MNNSLQFLKGQVGRNASASPSHLMRWLNPVLLSVEAGKVEFEYTIRDEMINPAGILHGGIIAAIMDDVIGCAAFSFGGKEFFGTINLSVDYVKPAREMEKVTAHADVIKKGSRLVNAKCELRHSATGELIAIGSAILITVIPKKPNKRTSN